MTHIVNTKIIQSLGNFNLLGSVEESIGKLFTLSQSALNDLEVRDIAQEVAHWLVWVRPGRVGVDLVWTAVKPG